MKKATTSRRSLRATLQHWQQLFDARALRERALLIGAAMALALALGDALWLGPARVQWQASRQQQRSAQLALETLTRDVQQLQQRQAQQAKQLRDELNNTRARVREGENQLRSYESTLVGPDRMIELLDHVLAGQGQLRVRAMRSLGRTDLLAPAAGSTALAQAAPPPAGVAPVGSAAAVPGTPASAPGLTDPALATLYRHGVELQLEGSYADLLDYLKTLEAMPQRVLWGGISLKVEQHPKAVLTLRLYTISRDRHWLEI